MLAIVHYDRNTGGNTETYSRRGRVDTCQSACIACSWCILIGHLHLMDLIMANMPSIMAAIKWCNTHFFFRNLLFCLLLFPFAGQWWIVSNISAGSGSLTLLTLQLKLIVIAFKVTTRRASSLSAYYYTICVHPFLGFFFGGGDFENVKMWIWKMFPV